MADLLSLQAVRCLSSSIGIHSFRFVLDPCAGAALGSENTTCCALSLLDQTYASAQPPSSTQPAWCSTYPGW